MMRDVHLSELPSQFQQWFLGAIEREASDLHLVPGYPAVLRCFGKLTELDSMVLTESLLTGALQPFWEEDLNEIVERDRDVDFAAGIQHLDIHYRLRVNLSLNQGRAAACIRIIPDSIPSFAWASFPEELADRLIRIPHGLILFTGITGAGKSTSLAMIIQRMNQRGGKRILTIEDPIEFRFPGAPGSVVTQREIGSDVDTFSDGLKYGLRQDPDVILVGEIRDRETAAMCLSSAETGHLVFSTLHTRDAKGAISRFADFYPQSGQNEVRAQLASLLRAVVCQRLLPSSSPNEKQELAMEILFQTPAISAAIRMNKLESVDNYILTGRNEGMITMDESIKRLLNQGLIHREDAIAILTNSAL